MGGVMWKQDAYGGRGKLLVKDGGDVFRTTPFTPSPPTLPRSVQHLFQRNLLGFSSLGTPLLTYPSPHTFPYTAPLRPDLHLLRWFLLPGRRLGPRRGPEAAGHTSAACPTLVRRLPHPPPSGCAALGATGLRYIGGRGGRGRRGRVGGGLLWGPPGSGTSGEGGGTPNLPLDGGYALTAPTALIAPTTKTALTTLNVFSGKTVLARAAAADAGATLFLLNGPDVMSEYYGVCGVGVGGLPW